MKREILAFFWPLYALLTSGSHLAYAQVAPSGNYLLLNGVNQYMAITDHADFNISGNESYSLSFRMAPENFDACYSIISKGNQMVPEGRYEFVTNNAPSVPNLDFQLYNSDYTNLGNPYLASLNPGVWVHIAWVYDAAEKSSKVYINGGLTKVTYNGAIGRRTVSNPHELLVGCSWTNALEPELFQFWPGRFDELRIWKRALTASEVAADLSAVKAAAEGLVAAYDFENIKNSSVPNVSGKAHHAMLIGYGIRVLNTELPVGRGEKNERLLAFRITTGPYPETIKSIRVVLNETYPASSIHRLNVYHNGPAERLNLQTARLFGSSPPTGAKTIISGEMKLTPGDNYFWVLADIGFRAIEGARINASVESYATADATVVYVPNVVSSRTVLLAHKLLFSPGDEGSKHYRIPAITMARDGSLVTVTDRRWNNQFDLPNHIDLVVRRSTNKGRSWSKPVILAGEGTENGFGDASLVVNQRNNQIICLFAGGSKGFLNSTAASPIRIYQAISSDNGISWSTPRDITGQIYGADCPNPATQNLQAAFVASGTAIQLKSGRLMAALTVRETSARHSSNFIMYSDDNAQNWRVPESRASAAGNEAKLVELDNSSVLMSIRNTGNRLFNLSADNGITWGTPYSQPGIMDPYCNGDMIRYTSVSAGYNRNRLLHSIPFANSRRNVSVLLSYDEGATWPVNKPVYTGVSGYSSLCILSDGSIGLYYEVGEYDLYQMYFARFSLDWLSGGTDTWTSGRHNSDDGSGDITPGPAAFTAYPNPAEGMVNVSGIFDRNTRIDIFNARGELMKSSLVDNPGDHLQLSLEGLTPGIYFIKIGGASQRIVVR